MARGEDLASRKQAIRNGLLRPTALNAGTARVYVWRTGADDRNEPQDCSAQVISRDTVLTAAHCIYNAGYYENGWVAAARVAVHIRHQEPNGLELSLTSAPIEYVTAFVKKEYVTQADSDPGSPRRWGYDVAVLRRSTNLANVVQEDVAALARYRDPKPASVYAYGHGLFDLTIPAQRAGDDIIFDDNNLRRAFLDNLTWNNTSGHEYYRTIATTVGPGDANLCLGDSGGPWKLPAYPYAGAPQVSGLQFGVTAGFEGLDGSCGLDKAYAAWTAEHDTWIQGIVEDGRGSCTTSNDYCAFDESGPTYIDVNNALACW